MSSTMAMWETAAPFADVLQSVRCRRCECVIRRPKPGQRYCTERCRKRAEKARWKAKWKAKGVNKYIGAREKEGAK